MCLAITSLCFWTSNVSAQTKITKTSDRVIIENQSVALSFDLKNGYYDIKDKTRDVVPVKNAYFQAEGLLSKERTETLQWSQEEVSGVFGKGRTSAF